MKDGKFKGYSKSGPKKAGVQPSKRSVKAAKPSVIKSRTKKSAEAVRKKVMRSPMKGK